MSYDIFSDPLTSITIGEHKQIINTINAHSYIIAKNDLFFQKSLQDSTILIPDGSGIVFATKILKNKNITKIAGADLHLYLLSQLNQNSSRCFYMGASQKTLDQIKERLAHDYPNVIAEFYSPPFKSIFSDEDNRAIINAVNAFAPDVLFVGMTAPKQEKWLHQHKDILNYKVATSIGAVFDFYAGNTKRPHIIFQKMHLEWLGRLLQEPRRLWKRNLSIPLFLFELLLHKLKVK